MLVPFICLCCQMWAKQFLVDQPFCTIVLDVIVPHRIFSSNSCNKRVLVNIHKKKKISRIQIYRKMYLEACGTIGNQRKKKAKNWSAAQFLLNQQICWSEIEEIEKVCVGSQLVCLCARIDCVALDDDDKFRPNENWAQPSCAEDISVTSLSILNDHNLLFFQLFSQPSIVALVRWTPATLMPIFVFVNKDKNNEINEKEQKQRKK